MRQHQFVSFDDFIYVTNNAHVKAGLAASGIAWAFATGYANFWHPLTWLSLMLDVQLFGVDPGALHVTAALLHTLSTLLLFLALAWMTRAPGRSAFVAALFAVHPLHVESVAWISERKDVLSTVFWMLTLVAYVAYVRQPGWSRYLIVIATFTLGLMAKPMLVTLPVVLLLLDVWPLGRMRTAPGGVAPCFARIARMLVVEKLPLFALALAAAIVAFLMQQRGGAVAGLDAIPLADRLANALASFAVYPARMLWPARLIPYYPYPPSIQFWPAFAGLLLLVGMSAVAVRWIAVRPYLAVGWFWYVVTLLPVIGIIQVGSHATADRYTYVPLVGLFILLAWGSFDLIGPRRVRRVALAGLAAAIIFACAAAARAQVMIWKDSATLWQHTLAVMPDNFCAHYGLGKLLDMQSRRDEAVRHLRESVRLAPHFADGRVALGHALAGQDLLDEAVEQYQEALRLAPASRDARAGLGLARERQGRFDEAAAQYRAALSISPGDAEMHNALGHALAAGGRLADAIGQFTEALRVQQDNVLARTNLADAFLVQGKIREALPLYREALRLQADYAPAHESLGRALAAEGSLPEAITELEEAVRLAPASPDAHRWLASVLANSGRADEAVAQYEQALRLHPARADIHDEFGFLLARQGKLSDAIAHFSEAVRLNPTDSAHLHLGMALSAAGEYGTGAAHLTEALRLNPANEAARRALGSVPGHHETIR